MNQITDARPETCHCSVDMAHPILAQLKQAKVYIHNSTIDGTPDDPRRAAEIERWKQVNMLSSDPFRIVQVTTLFSHEPGSYGQHP